jgi:hypothetical protein
MYKFLSWLPNHEPSDDLMSLELAQELNLTLNFLYLPLMPTFYNSSFNKKIWIKNLYEKNNFMKYDLVNFHGVVKNELVIGDLDYLCSRFETSSFFKEEEFLLFRNLLKIKAKDIHFDYFIVISNKKINLNHYDFLKVKNILEYSFDEFNDIKNTCN